MNTYFPISNLFGVFNKLFFCDINIERLISKYRANSKQFKSPKDKNMKKLCVFIRNSNFLI